MEGASLRVLVAADFPAGRLDELRALGLDVEHDPRCTAADLDSGARLREAHVLVVRSARVNRTAIESAPRLSLVIRAGAGVDTIDLAAAAERGVLVANCPGKNSVAVAELALGLALALDRRIPDATFDLRAGRWNKQEYARADGLRGRTLGIAGLGRVGSELAKRARALEMRVKAWSVPFRPERAQALGVEPCATLDELAETSDVVSVHLPQTPATRGLFGAAFFGRMKPRAIFVNTSRGGLVDEAALATAMRERGLRVGLDVFEGEPAAGVAAFRPALADAGLLVATPHIGASTEEAQDAIAGETVRLCAEFARTGTVTSAVNIEEQAPAECQLVVRHYDRVGVLASILGVLRAHEANVEEMTNRIFRGAKTAVATIRLSRMPEPAVFAEIAALEGAVIAVDAKRL